MQKNRQCVQLSKLHIFVTWFEWEPLGAQLVSKYFDWMKFYFDDEQIPAKMRASRGL